MKLTAHLFTAAGIGTIIYTTTGSWQLSIASSATEVLIDTDHVIEHIMKSPRPFCLKTFFGKNNTLDWSSVVFPLHSYELLVLLAGLAWFLNSLLLWACFLGMTIHLFLDEVGNRLPTSPIRLASGFYFFTYRLYMGFQTKSFLCPRKN
jgi:hypothetical protein